MAKTIEIQTFYLIQRHDQEPSKPFTELSTGKKTTNTPFEMPPGHNVELRDPITKEELVARKTVYVAPTRPEMFDAPPGAMLELTYNGMFFIAGLMSWYPESLARELNGQVWYLLEPKTSLDQQITQ